MPRFPEQTTAIAPRSVRNPEFSKLNSWEPLANDTRRAEDGTKLVSNRICTNYIQIHPLIKVLARLGEIFDFSSFRTTAPTKNPSTCGQSRRRGA